MATRLSHGRKPDPVSYEIVASAGFHAFVQAETGLLTGRRLSLAHGTFTRTGYDATFSVGDSDGNQSPSWTTVPTITFSRGTASNQSIAEYVSDPDGDGINVTHNGTSLPSGVTYNTASKQFEYDGTDAASGTNGHVLTADDLDGLLYAIITQEPASTIDVARGETEVVAKAYRTDGAQPTAIFIFASTGVERSIPDLTLSYALSNGVYDIRVTASVSATLTTYTDFGLEIT